jgi:hypothetical protein
MKGRNAMAIEVKVGDVVHVRGTVDAVSSDSVDVGFVLNKRSYSRWIDLDNVVHVEPPSIKVGDRVRHRRSADWANWRSADWTVLAIDGEMLWIKKMSVTVLHISVHRDEVQRCS